MPLTPSGKPCGNGRFQPSKCPYDILDVLQNNEGITQSDIRRLMHYKYGVTTINKHLSILRGDRKIECYIAGNMRKPLYRVVRP